MRQPPKQQVPIIIQLPNRSTTSKKSIEYSITTIRGDINTTIMITPQQITNSFTNSIEFNKKEQKPVKNYTVTNLTNFNKTCLNSFKKEKQKETSYHFLFGQQKPKRKSIRTPSNDWNKVKFLNTDIFDQSIEVQSRFQTDMTSQQSSQVSQSQVLECPNSLKPIFHKKQVEKNYSKSLKSYKSEPLIGIKNKCSTMNKLKHQLQQLEGKVSLLKQENQKMNRNSNNFL